MVSALLTASGIACVAWTAFELLQLRRVGLAGTPEAPPGPRACDGLRRGTEPGRRRRFAAWDDRGRPIDVEDLGPR